MADKKTPAEEVFAKYIANKRVLIADSSSASRAGLAKAMVNLGAKTNLLALTSSYEEAVQTMEKIKPEVVICDYDLGKGQGLNLLQAQRQQRPESKESLFVLVTGNSSQSAVAQAAEEDVDTFILKPYTLEVLRLSIMRAAAAKAQPNPYLVKITEGKKQIDAGQLDQAFALFEEAAKLDPKPALALYYLGQIEFLKKIMDQAQGKFQKGLEYNKIHYKCMVGLYELFMDKKDHTQAYEVVKKISRYFPANPQRLNSVLRLAITTKSYDDIERYYQVFTEIDQRNEELIRYICAALVVTGKFYLQKNLNSRALELFTKAAATGNGKTKILREIISNLLEFDLFNEAEDFLKKFPAESRKAEDYLVSHFFILNRNGTAGQIIEKGRSLIKEGISDPNVYKIMIERSQAAGFKEAASDLIHDAQKKWPNDQSFAQLNK